MMCALMPCVTDGISRSISDSMWVLISPSLPANTSIACLARDILTMKPWKVSAMSSFWIFWARALLRERCESAALSISSIARLASHSSSRCKKGTRPSCNLPSLCMVLAANFLMSELSLNLSHSAVPSIGSSSVFRAPLAAPTPSLVGTAAAATFPPPPPPSCSCRSSIWSPPPSWPVSCAEASAGGMGIGTRLSGMGIGRGGPAAPRGTDGMSCPGASGEGDG
mmetsp:Transcript_42149/g.119643  ORF Transcript_42149/g.119643 Transcript_42149/m.119643 type:complete len:224 (-) Transcript_42149:88-759(-)